MGGKKEGGGEPHEGHPSQKRVLDPLLSGTFSTPPQVSFLCFARQIIGNGPNTVSGSTVSNTELSEFLGAH